MNVNLTPNITGKNVNIIKGATQADLTNAVNNSKMYRDESQAFSIVSENKFVESAYSALNASVSATTASDKATIATTKANEANNSAINASASEAVCIAKATITTDKANIATAQSVIATDKANEASVSANAATTQAGIATTKASEASISAINALTSENNADTSEANALTYRNQAESFANSINPNDLVHISGTETITGDKTFSGTVSGLTKATVGLSNVDNTSDANKPISNAVQTALDFKADKATTLGGYGITDAYTKTSTDSLIDIHSKTAKTTLVDADEFMTADSATTFSLKKITWASIKTLLVNLFISKVTSTDNAIVRFNGVTGDVQNSGVIVDDSDRLLVGNTPSGLNTLGQLIVNQPSSGDVNLALTNKTNDSYSYIYNDGTALKISNSYNTTAGYKPIILQTGGSDRLILDVNGNVGIGVTPSAWAGWFKSIDIGRGSLFSSPAANEFGIGDNFYYDVATYRYKTSTSATYYRQGLGQHSWLTAPSGTAGNAITWNTAMTLDASGRLLVGSNGLNPIQGVTIRNESTIGVVDVGHASGTASGNQYNGYYYNGTLIGSILQAGTTSVAFNTTSDYRLKENIRPADCKRFMDIKFVDYERIDGRHECGVIAHELQEVYPDLVTGEKDATEIRKIEISPAIEEVKDEDGNVITEAVEAVYEEQEFPVYQQVNYMGLIARIGTVVQQQAKLIEELRLEVEILKEAK